MFTVLVAYGHLKAYGEVEGSITCLNTIRIEGVYLLVTVVTAANVASALALSQDDVQRLISSGRFQRHVGHEAA